MINFDIHSDPVACLHHSGIPQCTLIAFYTSFQVISRACRLMQIPSLEAGRIKPWTIPALKDLQYIIREINMFIEVGRHAFGNNLFIIWMFGCHWCFFCPVCQSTEAVMSICTLYELGQSLAGLKNKKHYEELNLGPLCKLPLIHRMFKIDSNTKDDDIQQIETADILKVHLQWRNKIWIYSIKLYRQCHRPALTRPVNKNKGRTVCCHC